MKRKKPLGVSPQGLLLHKRGLSKVIPYNELKYMLVMPNWSRRLAATQILPSSSLGASSTKYLIKRKLVAMPKFKHITLNALRGNRKLNEIITTKNESDTMDLTLCAKEAEELHKRFFIDIESSISDELMETLLDYFKEEGSLFDKSDLRRL